LNNIFFEATKNTKNVNANLVKETSSFFDNNIIIKKDLNNNNIYYNIYNLFALNKTSYILLSNLFDNNRFVLSKSIIFKRNKIAKQFRKSIIFAKFIDNKKTSKRSKQACLSVANNIELDVLQQALIDYFKD